jgi:hypothetical protein
MDIHHLKEALQKSWHPQTSYDPAHWSEDNPAWGQCAVTALIVQDHLGGDLVYTEAHLPDGQKIPHYLNALPRSRRRQVDLTCDQFPVGTVIPKGQSKKDKATRDYVLSYEHTQHRYHLLKESVERNLQTNKEKARG